MRIVFILLLIHSNALFAQKQASIWYFGQNAGLDFRNGEPVALTDGALNTLEGSASIADENGNLLFYTDGATVWNKLHEVMPNGRNLWGSYTTTQTLIVPKPGNEPIYYIFTASPQFDEVFGPNTDSVGFHYSVVDMNLDGGLGDVIQKNILLFKNTTEKVTAVQHANGHDIWVVAHEWGNNTFRSFLIADGGVITNAVTSSIGSIHIGGGFEPNDNYNAIGQMKLSSNGTILGVVIPFDGKIELFSFDNNTGQVLSEITAITNIGNEILSKYSIEFSPNGKMIYYTISTPTGCSFNDSDNPAEVWQYSLKRKRSVKVASFIGSINAIQLALNGKIYITQCNDIAMNSNFIGVINNPSHESIDCNYETKGIDLLTGKNTLGLPNFIQSYFLFPDPVIDMPNIFTPNGDLYNQAFKPISFENILEGRLKIINRWGKEVFSTTEILTGWDGGDYSPGVYYWLLTFEGKNGKTGIAKGWVHLIR